MQQEEETSAASDAALLRRFVRQGRQAAFSELVARYSGLVYSTCLRDIRDVAVAEDAAQAVFLILARKAPALRPHTSLAGWLYRTARLVSRNAAQQERRVRLREQRLGQHMAAEEAQRPPENDPWNQIEPVLHAALDALGRQEREVLLLRFFDDRSLKETGAALGMTEDAARMRVSRSLEKMRRHLSQADVVLPTAALAGLLTEKAVQAAPAALQQLVLPTAPGLNAPAGSASIPRAYQLAQGATKQMFITKAVLTGLIAISTTGGVVGILHGGHPRPPLLAQNTPVQTPPTDTSETTALTPQAIIAQSGAATGALKSLRADLHWSLSAGGATARVAESFTLQHPNLARLDPDPRDRHAIRTLADGSFTWRYRPDTRRFSRNREAPDGRDVGRKTRNVDAFVRFFFDPSLTGLRVEPSVGDPLLRYVGEQTWRGSRYQVVEIKQKAQQFQQVENTTLAFFGEDHLLHRVLITTVFDDGTESYIEAFLSNVRINDALPAGTFVLVPPQDAAQVNTVNL